LPVGAFETRTSGREPGELHRSKGEGDVTGCAGFIGRDNGLPLRKKKGEGKEPAVEEIKIFGPRSQDEREEGQS